MFVVVPLGKGEHCGKFNIPAYDEDVTHVTIKSLNLWSKLYEDTAWTTEQVSFDFPGCKENWTSEWPQANEFFVLSNSQI